MSVYDDLEIDRNEPISPTIWQAIERCALLVDLYGWECSSEDAVVDLVTDLLLLADHLDGASALSVIEMALVHREEEMEL